MDSSLFLLAAAAAAAAAAPPAVITVGNTSITLCTAAIVRVQHFGGTVPALPRLVVNNEWTAPVAHSVHKTVDATTITTAAIVVDILHSTGAVRFSSPSSAGQPRLAELSHELGAEQVSTTWDSPLDEAIYGLGQQNFGLVDYRGTPVPLKQWNLWAAVPFFVSTRGWGLLWDTSYATASFNPVSSSERVAFDAYVPSHPCPCPYGNYTNATATATFEAAAGEHVFYIELPELIWCSQGMRVTVDGVRLAHSSPGERVPSRRDALRVPTSGF